MRFKELFSGFSHSRSGTLLVGGIDGFTEFCPESIVTASRPPNIVITSVSVFDKELPASVLAWRSIQLTHDQNFFAFTFAALDYAEPARNRFALTSSPEERP